MVGGGRWWGEVNKIKKLESEEPSLVKNKQEMMDDVKGKENRSEEIWVRSKWEPLPEFIFKPNYKTGIFIIL